MIHGAFTPDQVDVLLQPIKSHRVAQSQGFSHVEAYDIRAMLIRVFGFGGFDEVSVDPPVLLYEMETQTKAGKAAYKVAYRASRRLVIRAMDERCVYEGTAVGESTMPDYKRGDAHDMAIKTAESQALKRCAINLGDQFGLSLYADGSLKPLVFKVIGHEPAQPKTDAFGTPKETKD